MSAPRAASGEPEPVIYPRSEHPISRSQIDPDAVKIMYRLVRAGFKAYLVGGGVRDLLLGKTPKDFDIATDATPRRIKALFRNSRIIGRRFKLVHIFFGMGKNIEVSTFRDSSTPIDPNDTAPSDAAPHDAAPNDSAPDDSDQNGAAPNDDLLISHDNTFGTEATDAVRRDLTINALFYDIATFSIIDYIGGMNDLRDRLIRIIGNPDLRFAEDPVRLLRVIRHAARAGFTIEASCLKSLERNRALILKSSQVRVYEEVKKDLTSGYVLSILRLLGETGMLEYILPELLRENCILLQDGAHLPMYLERIDAAIREGESITPTVVLAIIALLVPKAEEAPLSIDTMGRFQNEDEIADHIKFVFRNLTVPRKERERVEGLLAAWMRLCNVPGPRFKVGGVLRGTEASDLIAFHRTIHGEDEHDPILDTLLHSKDRHPERTRRDGRNRHRRRPR